MKMMAEREGFEPSERLRAKRFSSPLLVKPRAEEMGEETIPDSALPTATVPQSPLIAMVDFSFPVRSR